MRLKAQNRVRLRLSPILHFQFNKSSVHIIITFLSVLQYIENYRKNKVGYKSVNIIMTKL